MASGCVILGGGKIRNYSLVKARISADDYIICADSGYDHCARLGVTPHLLVGDFDSIRTPPSESIERVLLPAEKNYTDTAYSIEQALQRGHCQFLLAGVLGGRLDHTLANLQSLARLSRNGIPTCLTDGPTDIFALTDEAQTFPSRPAYYFTLISLTEHCEGVTIQNAKYPLHNYTLTFDDPRAISNEFIGKPVTISVHKGTLAVVMVPMEPFPA